MARLENWGVVGDGYSAPELGRIYLVGEVYDDNTGRFEDGSPIHTSLVAGSKGRFVKTASGSTYELGKINPEYRDHVVNTLGKKIDEAQPVKIIKKWLN